MVGAVSHGTISPAPGVHQYSYNQPVTVTFSASPGYHFDHWVRDGSNVGTPQNGTVQLVIYMTGNHTVTAVSVANPGNHNSSNPSNGSNPIIQGGQQLVNNFNNLPVPQKAAVVIISTASLLFVAVLMIIISSRVLQKGASHKSKKKSGKHKSKGGKKK
jgi:hypothetical protein